MPERAKIAIVGGGIWGSSIAFQLAKLGEHDVILLDKGPLAAETSSQGAGFLCSVRPTESMTWLLLQSTRFYARFEQETGCRLDLHMAGGVRIALTAERLAEMQRDVAMARRVGVEAHEMSAAEVGRLLPLVQTGAIHGGYFVPFEGYVADTRQAALGMARAAQRRGVCVRSTTPVTNLSRAPNGEFVLTTSQGPLRAEVLVLAAGATTGHLARQLGVAVPAYPIQHQCLVVSPAETVPATMPTVRIPDHDLYIRHEDGGLLIGGVGTDPIGPDPTAPTSALELAQVGPDRDVLARAKSRAEAYFPMIRDAFVMREQRGLPMVSPDLNFVLGPVSAVPRLFVASGCTLRGVQSAPGVGALLAQMIVSGAPEIDPSEWRVDRFGDEFQDPGELYRACRQAIRPR